jgi:uncharacterized membrane protein YphA (DoxX/SURF4 family)
MNYHALLYCFGTILLGVVGLCFGDFALQWQGVPREIPRMPLAYVSAALLIAGGALIVARRERIGALGLAAFFGFWVVAFHLPAAFRSASHVGSWNAPAEITFLAMGGLALFASYLQGTRRDFMLKAARVLAGASAMVFGSAHFNYIDLTANFVPSWIPPSQVFWAWATGVGHLLAGFAMASDTLARLATTCLAGMMGSFALLVHLPRVINAPDNHAEWIMLAVSSALSGSALLIRRYATIQV